MSAAAQQLRESERLDRWYAYNGITLDPPADSRAEAIERTKDDPRRHSLIASRLLREKTRAIAERWFGTTAA